MGKLAVPEYILNKPGPLTSAEFDKMKLHASVGADILSSIDFPYPVVPIVRHHHESWDGTGYPDGLAGTDIPIGARILAVVDCFDALTSDRPYRPRLSNREALRILERRRGSMYDPLVVDAFLRAHDELSRLVPSSASHAIKPAAGKAHPISASATRLEEIAASSGEMVTLYGLARALTSTSALNESLDALWTHLRRLVPASTCIFFTHDLEHDDLKAVYVSGGEHSEILQQIRVPLGQRLSGWVATNRQTIRNSDPTLDFGEIARTASLRLRSSLSTVVISDESLVGVLSLYATQVNAFTEEHERVIEAIARQSASVLAERLSIEQRSNTVSPPAVVRALNSLGLPPDDRVESAQGVKDASLILLQGRCFSDLAASDSDQEVIASIRSLVGPRASIFRAAPQEIAIVLPSCAPNEASVICDALARIVASKISGLRDPQYAIGFVSGGDERPTEKLLAAARATLRRVSWNVAAPPGSSIH